MSTRKKVRANLTEYFGAQEVAIFFLSIIYFIGKLRELRASHAKKKLRYFLSVTDIHTHTHIYIYTHTHKVRAD